MQPFEHELHRRGEGGGFLRPQRLHGVGQAVHVTKHLLVGIHVQILASLHAQTLAEAVYHRLQIVYVEVPVEHRLHAGGQQPRGDAILLAFLHRLELHLALQRRQHEREVGNARHHVLLAQPQGAAEGVGQQRLVVGDGGAHGNAGALVHVRRAARLVRDLGDDLLHPRRHMHAVVVHVQRRRLLFHDGHLMVEALRIVRADLCAVAVFQRRDDAPAVGVVLRVRGGDEEHVQRQAHLVAADLHVALLQHVEQAHLDALGQIRQFVDGEDAAVGARHQTEMHRQLVAEVAPFGHLDGVHFADQIRDGDVRRGEFLRVPFAARQPSDRRVVAGLGDDGAPLRRGRLERILGDLRLLQHRDLGVQQPGNAARDARLGLPALSEKDDVLPAQQRVHELRRHRFFVADDAGKQRLAAPQLGDEIAAQLHLHRQGAIAGRLELPQGRGFFGCLRRHQRECGSSRGKAQRPSAGKAGGPERALGITASSGSSANPPAGCESAHLPRATSGVGGCLALPAGKQRRRR